VPAIILLGAWFVLQLFSGVGSLGPTAQSSGVAYWAHVGGFIAGALLMAVFLKLRGEPLWPRYRRSPWTW
jgi:hypothetical protein